MGDFTRNKRPAATAPMESSSTSLSFSNSKRSKITAPLDSLESEFPSPNLRLENRPNSPRRAIFPATSWNSGDFCSGLCSVESLASFCSSNESLEIVKDGLRFVDLEAKSEIDISACINSNKFSRENTPSSEFRGEPEEMECPVKKTPSPAEIDEFFSASENLEQKRFAEKYNYDIVKDLPLEGRYLWVRLKP